MSLIPVLLCVRLNKPESFDLTPQVARPQSEREIDETDIVLGGFGLGFNDRPVVRG